MHQLCRAFIPAKRIAAGHIQIGEISVNSKKDADVRFALTGQWLKSITFHLPIIDGEMKIPVNNGLDKNAHVETVRCNI